MWLPTTSASFRQAVPEAEQHHEQSHANPAACNLLRHHPLPSMVTAGRPP